MERVSTVSHRTAIMLILLVLDTKIYELKSRVFNKMLVIRVLH